MIDAIIAAIRASDDRPAARDALMAAPFEFTEVQAKHILDMTAGRLTRLGRTELEEEMAKLRETIAELEAILGDEAKLRGSSRTSWARSATKFATRRESQITYDPGDIDIEDLIDDEELVVTMTGRATSRPSPADAFRTQGRGGRGVAGRQAEGRGLRHPHHPHDRRTPTCCSSPTAAGSTGCKAHEIPMKERTARGTAIVNLLPLQPGETIQAIIDTRDYETNRYLFFATKQGQVKKTAFSEYDTSRRAGLIAINLRDGDELVRVIPTNGDDDIFMVTRPGMTIRFTEDDVRPMGRAAAGVRGMKLRAGDEVVSLRRRPRRRRHPDRHRRRLRQAHPARPVQPPGPRRPGRARHQADRPAGRRGGRLHGRPRRRDLRHRLRRRRHPHAGPRDLLAGPRRHRRAGHEPDGDDVVAAVAPVLQAEEE